MGHYLTFLLGVLCAGLGGEAFVRGTVGLARWARISPGLIAATVAASATSSPELAVGLTAAFAGTPALSLGNILGSNVYNIAFILGVTLLLGDLRGTRRDFRRDLPLAAAVPFLIGLLALDGRISRLDGVLLLGSFTAWMAIVSLQAYRQHSAAGKVLGDPRHGRAGLLTLVGLALLIGSAHFIVSGAQGIAVAWGLDDFIVGALIVAIGTTIPELTTTVIAKLRGHDEISLGTILGTIIFNGLCVIGVVAVVHPIAIQWDEISVALLAGIITLVVIVPTRHTRIPRWRGLLLLSIYATYVWAILTR